VGEGAVDPQLAGHAEAANARVEVDGVVEQRVEAADLNVGGREAAEGVVRGERGREQRVAEEGLLGAAVVCLGACGEQRLREECIGGKGDA